MELPNCENAFIAREKMLDYLLDEDNSKICNRLSKLIMIKEFVEIVLMVDIPAQSLMKGDVGVVVEVYGNNEGYEVEFMTKEGVTIAVLTLDVNQVRPIGKRDIMHVRELDLAA